MHISSNGSKDVDQKSNNRLLGITAGRTLAVDIRPWRFGYAAFETPTKILSFGISRFDSLDKARKRVSVLVRTLSPSTIVVRRLSQKSRRDRHGHTSTAKIVREEARLSSISVHYVTETVLKSFFRGIGKRNKYEIAVLLSVWFPDLRWKLPARRKCYMPEPWSMALFDAAALGTAYLASGQDARGEL